LWQSFFFGQDKVFRRSALSVCKELFIIYFAFNITVLVGKMSGIGTGL
jgi:hypothetical protein